MSNLGSAKTSRYQIGTAELRVGPMSLANKLTQAHSVGLVDDAGVNNTKTYAKLEGGFPKKVVDQAPISVATTITATAREFSRRNIGILLGNGIMADSVDVANVVTASASVTAATLTSATGFAVNDLVVVFVADRPETASVAKISAIATNDLTFDSDLCLAMTYGSYISAGEVVRIFKAAEIAVGRNMAAQYFSVQMVQQDSQSGRPRIWNFWKASCSAGLDYGTNSSDYGSTKMEFEVLEPSAADYGSIGSALYGVRGLIPSFPMGMYVAGSDVTT